MSHANRQLSFGAIVDVFSLSDNATAIYTSEELIIEAVTDSMLRIWGKDRSVTGMRFADAIPEIKDQPFTKLLQEVWRTGVTYEAKDTPATLRVEGKLQTFYFDFTYRAIKNEAGTTYCILHTATDVTERRASRGVLYKKEEQEKALIEEVRTANEELVAVNNELRFLVESLSESREQLRLAVESAELGFFTVNPKTRELRSSARLKELFGFYADEEMPFELAVDNIHEGYRERVLQAVEATLREGKPYDIEYPVTGYRDGRLRWLRATGKLFTNERYPEGNFSGTAQDITAQKTGTETITRLNAELQDSVEKLSDQTDTLWLAIRSADIGLWQIDLADNTTILSDRMKAIHGIPPDREITFDEALSAVGEEYRQPVNEKMVKAVETGELFVADYKIYRMDGSGTGWVRSTGIVKDMAGGRKKILIGA